MVYGFELQGLSEKGWETIHVYTPEDRSQAFDRGREYVDLGIFVAFKVERLWRSCGNF
jgi:hypothetical protein